MLDTSWPQIRLEELKSLEILLTEIKALNRGGDIIARIERCERLAGLLTEVNIAEPRLNFINFLKYQAVQSLPEITNKKENSNPPTIEDKIIIHWCGADLTS